MTAASTQVTTPLTQVGLSSAVDERLTHAAHSEAMPVQLEGFEAEAEGRRQWINDQRTRDRRYPLGRPLRSALGARWQVSNWAARLQRQPIPRADIVRGPAST